MTFKPRVAAALTTALLLTPLPARSQSVTDQCRAYARAIEAVAEARDNLDEPSWDNLVKLHPILKENGKNKRAVLYARLISLRAANKKATPRALKMDAFEGCPSDYMCLFLNENCPNK